MIEGIGAGCHFDNWMAVLQHVMFMFPNLLSVTSNHFPIVGLQFSPTFPQQVATGVSANLI